VRRESHAALPGAPDPWAASEMPAFRSRPPYLMTEMIAAEPALAERLVHRLARDEAVERVATRIREARAAASPIILTGAGTSEHAAMGIAELLNEGPVGAGAVASALPPLEVLRRMPRADLLIAVSHEGGTQMTNEALAAMRDARIPTALITASDRSPAAQIADSIIRTEEQDQSWCHTVGYLSPLVVGMALAARLGQRPLDAQAIRAVLDVTADARAAASVAAGLVGIDRLVVAGAGVDYISAREMALKVSEGARLPASAIELETVMHGHLAAATRWTGIVVVLTGRIASAKPVERARRVLAAARALSMPAAAILTDSLAGEIERTDTPAGRIVLPHVDRVSGVGGSLIGSTTALQLLAERLARARGVDPDTLGREDPAQAAAHG
jgi:glucosamine 6-phosphate synthetase-like amidotransferase/phosphosugar isomerase protein